MSSTPDKGRRRRRLDDEGEEGDVENVPVAARPSECESEGENADVELSEYESAVDESADPDDETEEGSETDTEEGSETESGSETETEGGEGYTDEEGLEEERQSGDGEEQPDNEKPDDDEDKKNPAYVPRKGAFYEHDFRDGDEGQEEQEPEELKPKKKLWQDEGKWSHDRYSDEQQAPKSREELIAIYGYDIRTGDKPPEAPPRRPGRGRGPQKQRIQDFMPRMAIIDTTEDGRDSVPNLGDDELILYDDSQSRNARRNNMNNSEGRRGGRGGNRGRGNFRGGEIESENQRNRFDNNNDGKNSQNGKKNLAGNMVHNINKDFPSLEEAARPQMSSDKNDIARSGGKWAKNQQQNELSYHGGQARDEGKGGKYSQHQDTWVEEESRLNNSRYQQNQSGDRRGGYNSRGGRESNYKSRGQEDNWRSGPKEYRDGNDFSRGKYNGGNRDYGYNNRRQQTGWGDKRGGRVGNSGDTGGPNRREKYGYEQAPRYQQQQGDMQVSGRGVPKEFMNSSYKAAEEKNQQKGSGPAGSNMTDSGDGSTSNNVVISNKENVQTINVTITSTTTEKKSYAKERRAKGGSRSSEGSVMMGNTEAQKAVPPSNHYQGLPQSGMKVDPNSAPQAGAAKRYSSQRQQGLKGAFTEPPPVDNSGAKLYNPSLPPPSFYQRDPTSVATGHHPTPSSPGGVQDPTHFTPTMLPPTAALPYGLPVSGTGLPMAPTGSGIPANPAMFQPPRGPPPPPPPASIQAPGAALLGPPYLPTGLMYTGGPRVPPPGTQAGFPIPMAYTSPPPPTTVATTGVGNQSTPQGSASQPGIQSNTQPKKVYRGDITYYAPELQQPSRTPLKRPKAAIPIIDPQEMPHHKQRDKQTPEKASVSPSKQISHTSNNSNNGKGWSNSSRTFTSKATGQVGYGHESVPLSSQTTDKTAESPAKGKTTPETTQIASVKSESKSEWLPDTVSSQDKTSDNGSCENQGSKKGNVKAKSKSPSQTIPQQEKNLEKAVLPVESLSLKQEIDSTQMSGKEDKLDMAQTMDSLKIKQEVRQTEFEHSGTQEGKPVESCVKDVVET